MLKKRFPGYYSRMLLICIAIVCSVTIAAFILSDRLIERQEATEFLKTYDIELNNLSSSVSGKLDAMANGLSPLFSSTTRYNDLCDMLQNGMDSTSASYHEVIQMLGEICRYDEYCRGALLLANNGRFYQYDTSYETLMPLSLRQNTLNLKPYELRLLSDAQISGLSLDYESPGEPVYGIVSTIFGYYEARQVAFGHMIMLYSTTEFVNSISGTPSASESVFTITGNSGDILFASNGDYTDDPGRIYTDLTATGNSTLQIPATLKEAGENEYYHAASHNNQYDFYVYYQVPAALLQKQMSHVVIGALACFICLSSILLYIFTLRTSDRKIKGIQAGMSLIGQNNLDYRMELPKSNDEFSQIIKSFNRMCDELQKNVEKAYIYELSQKKAELYAMQTSINPHFLYNTLEQIRFQIKQGRDSDASQMLLLLSKLYRAQTKRNLYVTIGEEVSLCEALINLYMFRFGNFDYEFRLGQGVRTYGIPKNTLQPLVENYFVHGLVGTRDDNLLTIDIRFIEEADGKWIEFVVEDNGSSITKERLYELKQMLAEHVLDGTERSGFALSNVNARLKLIFGDASGIHPSVGSNHTGFKITFRIPPTPLETLLAK